MEKKNLENMSYWKEPVHPMIIKLNDDLVAIYKFIRDNYQKEIDNAFDRASQQIGFVVTTTMPVMLDVGERGTIKGISIALESMKGTALEKELSTILGLMKKSENRLEISPGVFNIVLFWYEAVKLRLRTDWMEPVHSVYDVQSELMGLNPRSQNMREMAPQYRPWLEPVHNGPWCRPWMEPAHYKPWCEPVHHGSWGRPWMEPAHPVFETESDFKRTEAMWKGYEHQEPAQFLNWANKIALEKTILISAIDEVYPELKLGERLDKAQYAMSSMLHRLPKSIWPGIREPAHVISSRQWSAGPQPDPWKQAMIEIARAVWRYGPVPDPWKDQFLSEIASILERYSYVMLNPQPLPPKEMSWYGVREPAHLMTMSPSWSGDPTQQLLSEIASILRRYGGQV
jgi:hypothetical protein